jgi:hypothetical protein
MQLGDMGFRVSQSGGAPAARARADPSYDDLIWAGSKKRRLGLMDLMAGRVVGVLASIKAIEEDVAW